MDRSKSGVTLGFYASFCSSFVYFTCDHIDSRVLPDGPVECQYFDLWKYFFVTAGSDSEPALGSEREACVAALLSNPCQY